MMSARTSADPAGPRRDAIAAPWRRASIVILMAAGAWASGCAATHASPASGVREARATDPRSAPLPARASTDRPLEAVCLAAPAPGGDRSRGSFCAPPDRESERAARHVRLAKPAPAGSCAKDMDCPGDDVCVSGQCTRPGGKPSGTGPDAGAPNEGKPAPTPKVVITDRAREQFEIGVRLLEADGGPRLTEAYEAFKAAYAESPSPKILGNLGLCAMMLERDGEAIDAYERYVAEVTDAGADERKRIDNDLVILRGRAATVELSVSPPGGTLVDERVPDTGAAVVNRYPISASPLSLRIRAGKHRMRIELAGYEAASVALDVAAGAVERRNVVLEPKQTAPAPTAATAKPTAPPTATSAPTGTPPAQGPGVVPAKSMPTSAVAMLVVTGAIGAAAIVTGALALDRKSTYDEYGAGGSRKEAEDVRAEGETLNITTDVLLGTTAAAAIVTLVLFFVDSGDAPDPAATTAQRHEAPSPRVDVLPLVGIDAAGGSVSITF